MDSISMFAAVDILSQHVETQANEVAGVELSPALQVESDIAREKLSPSTCLTDVLLITFLRPSVH